MTFILLNDDKTIHSVAYSDESATPIYVAHRLLKGVEKVMTYPIPFRQATEWQKQVLEARRTQP